jgi:hypothetical protein
MLRALGPLFANPNNKDKKLDFAGYSQGAITALSLAERAHYFGYEVRNVFALETPGIKDFTEKQKFKKLRGGINIMRAFASDASNLSWYQKDPHDEVQRKVSKVDSKKNVALEYVDLIWGLGIKPASRRGMFTAYPIAMARNVVPNILESLLRENPNAKITLVNGSESNISGSLKDSNVRTIILPGDTHSVGERAKRIGWLFRFVTADKKNTS